ncbi:MAG: hypothetical protein WCW02_04210 [Candidatus Buchananbacteria bacterium]
MAKTNQLVNQPVKSCETFNLELISSRTSILGEDNKKVKRREKRQQKRIEQEIGQAIMSLLMSIHDDRAELPQTYLATGASYSGFDLRPFRILIGWKNSRNRLTLERPGTKNILEDFTPLHEWHRFAICNNSCFDLKLKFAILFFLEKLCQEYKIEIQDYSGFTIKKRIVENLNKIIAAERKLPHPELLTAFDNYCCGGSNHRRIEIFLQNYQGKVALLKYDFPLFQTGESKGLPTVVEVEEIYKLNEGLSGDHQKKYGEVAIANKLDDLIVSLGLLGK